MCVFANSFQVSGGTPTTQSGMPDLQHYHSNLFLGNIEKYIAIFYIKHKYEDILFILDHRKDLKGIVVNRSCHSSNEGSMQIKLYLFSTGFCYL